MPLLPDPVSTPNVKQFYLPKPDKDENGNALPVEKQAWVKMDMRPMSGMDITKGMINTDDPVGGIIAKRILEWNFIDEQGRPVPITYENFMRIGRENIAYLLAQPLDELAPLTDDQKKTSTPTVTQ